MAVSTTCKNRIMIHGSKSDGSYIVEFRIADREALAISARASGIGRPILWRLRDTAD
jgi:hypothetical protein